MRLTLPTLLLAVLAACGDSSAVVPGDNSSTNSPNPPINGNDDSVFTQPGVIDSGTSTGGLDGGGTGGGDGPGQSSGGGGGGGGPGAGGGGGSGTGGGGGGSPPGAPVPEPGTMLLVGSGLVGAAMARRRRAKNGADAANETPAS